MNNIGDFDAIEIDKENVEPRGSGRSAAALQIALNAGSKMAGPHQNDSLSNFFLATQTACQSDDPLHAYDAYIRETIVKYPQGNTKESVLVDILESTVKAFIDDGRYKSDVRFLKWCLLYARYVDIPDDVYSHLLANEIGTGFSALYEAYGQWLEKCGRVEKADMIYELGLQKHAEPYSRLLKIVEQFKARYKISAEPEGSNGPRFVLGQVLTGKSSSFHRDGECHPVKKAISIFNDDVAMPKDKVQHFDAHALTKRHLAVKENVQFSRTAQGSKIAQQHRDKTSERIVVFHDVGCKRHSRFWLTRKVTNEDSELNNEYEQCFEEKRAFARNLLGIEFQNDLASCSATDSCLLGSLQTREEESNRDQSVEQRVQTQIPSPTINTKAALEDIISIFNQPLKKINFVHDENGCSQEISEAEGVKLFNVTHDGEFNGLDLDGVDDDEVGENENTASVDDHISRKRGFYFMTPIQERTEPDLLIFAPPLSEVSIRSPSGAKLKELGHESLKALDMPTSPKTSTRLVSMLVHDDVAFKFVKVPTEAMNEIQLNEASNVDALRNDFDECSRLQLASDEYSLYGKVAEGGFSTVFLAKNGAVSQNDLALKIEKPASEWEAYILSVISRRLKSRALKSIIKPYAFYSLKNASCLVLPYVRFGTVVDLVNAIGGGNGLDELLVMFFTIELLRTVQCLHTIGIIHGDLKPDNCLIRFPSTDDEVSSDYMPNGGHGWDDRGIYLIDFGRSVDMNAYPPGKEFVCKWPTDMHDCPEMREGMSWSFEVDNFGMAAIIHTMLFGQYIETKKDKNEAYVLTRSFRRYWQTGLWHELFNVLMNSGQSRESSNISNDLERLVKRFEDYLSNNHTKNGKSLKALLFKCEIALLERFTS